MLYKLDAKIFKWLNSRNRWTNVYGLARSLIALSTLLTLLINDAEIFLDLLPILIYIPIVLIQL